MLDSQYFHDCIKWLSFLHRWGDIEPEIVSRVYESVAHCTNEQFKSIVDSIATEQWAKPANITAAAAQYRSQPHDTKALPQAPPEPSEVQVGQAICRRFMAWALVASQNGFEDSWISRNGKMELTQTGAWLSSLPWFPEELNFQLLPVSKIMSYKGGNLGQLLKQKYLESRQ